MTRTATKTGAIALSAPTNSLPAAEIHCAPGKSTPSPAPITIPIMILIINPVSVYFFKTFFIKLIPCSCLLCFFIKNIPYIYNNDNSVKRVIICSKRNNAGKGSSIQLKPSRRFILISLTITRFGLRQLHKTDKNITQFLLLYVGFLSRR